MEMNGLKINRKEREKGVMNVGKLSRFLMPSIRSESAFWKLRALL